MKDKYILTAESVTEGHPDKLCDTIADSVLEEAVMTVFDLSTAGMIRHLKLSEPGFSNWCNYGHFSHADAPWEETDCADLIREACEHILEGSHV